MEKTKHEVKQFAAGWRWRRIYTNGTKSRWTSHAFASQADAEAVALNTLDAEAKNRAAAALARAEGAVTP